MWVQQAEYRDIRNWLDLAAEVERLFGTMLDEPGFYQALLTNIARGTAFCMREGDGLPGTPLMGGLLFSPRRAGRPDDRIGWLAVAKRWHRHGVGRQLVEHCIGLAQPPANLSVITFGADVVAGQAARRFYERLGFRPAEPAPRGPEGGSRQVYRRECSG
jgi:GNAT superfamily N-acetyltransferase